MRVVGGRQENEMEVGVIEVNWRSVGALTAGAAVDMETHTESHISSPKVFV